MSAGLFYCGHLTHFWHTNIIKYCNRPFVTTSSEEHTWKIIDNWNNTVGVNDEVRHLGDFAWNNGSRIVPKLNGKIHLVYGNHDVKQLKSYEGLFESIEVYHELRDLDKLPIILMHYPMRSWNRAFHGSWSLYGHVHGRIEDLPWQKTMDVGIDAVAKLLGDGDLRQCDYRPIAFEEIKEIMDNKPVFEGD